MVRFKKKVTNIVKKAKSPLKKIRLYIKQQLGWLGIPKIVPYIGFGNKEEIFITGTVVEDKGLSKPVKGQGFLKNMLAMIKRYVSDEITGVRVKVRFLEQEKIAETNELGLFHCVFKINGEIPAGNWQEAHYELMEETDPVSDRITARGLVMVLQKTPDFGIISDIDDTFLVSHSTNTMKKLRLMLFKNAHTRIPFEGVAAFYKALQNKEKNNEEEADTLLNPIFYVSSSEWNLYDLLIDFCEYHGIPRGPFLLREMETSIFKFWKSGGGSHDHKFEKIRFIMSVYPDTGFVLIGDSGQHDPEIYTQIVKEHPGRIRSIYIRNISSAKREKEITELVEEVKKHNTEMILVKDTEEAARHAIMKGFIDTAMVPSIHIEKEKDKETSSDLANILRQEE